MELKELFGCSTGMGSVPHRHPREGLDFVYTYLRKIPHWPQLPQRSPAEGFIAQYLSALLQRDIILRDGQNLYFSTTEESWPERFYQLFEFLLQEDQQIVEKEFSFPPDSAAGFYAMLNNKELLPSEAVCVKGQLSGPVTVGLVITDGGGKPAFYNPELREILVKALAAHGSWQARQLQCLGLSALIFIDDPGLLSYGSSSTVGLGRDDIQNSIGQIAAAIRETGAFTGLHCCSGADWSLLFDLPLNLISFDAYEYFPSLQVYAEGVDAYLRNGGALAWGIIPTSERAWQHDAGSLQGLLEEKLTALIRQGVDESRLLNQLIITPACGTGTLTLELAEKIYQLTADLTERMRG